MSELGVMTQGSTVAGTSVIGYWLSLALAEVLGGDTTANAWFWFSLDVEQFEGHGCPCL